MTTFLLLGTATESSRPMIAQDATWLDLHLATIEASNAALKHFHFMLGTVDMVFAIDAPDATTADKVALALSAHGVLRVQSVRAYSASEYRALVAPPRPPLYQVYDLDTLRSETSGLVEHHTDSQTTHLDDYATTIIRTGGHSSDNPRADLAVSVSDEVMLKFAEGISAIGFTYQQGLYNASFELHLADDITTTINGSGFLPYQSFMGLVAQQPITGMLIRTQGSLYLQDFYFYADRRYQPSLAAEPSASLSAVL